MKTLVIHTGGTIGMVQTEQGFAPKAGVVEDCLIELQYQGQIKGRFDLSVAMPLIDSANATPQDWNWIATRIAKHHSDYDAFVVTHGTDTLAYTSSALCFALEGLQKPVILTGAMLPLTEPQNDGRRNLLDAMATARDCAAGVWVQFAGQKLHGTRVRKSHSSAFDAFNASPSSALPIHQAAEFRRHSYGDFNVPVLGATPGMSGCVVQFCAQRADGIVLRCYGSGTLPDSPDLTEALKTAQQRGIPVIAVSQCAEGGISLGTYAAGSLLQEAGVIDGRDATAEAAYAKLQYVLSRHQTPKARRDALAQPLCGEFS